MQSCRANLLNFYHSLPSSTDQQPTTLFCDSFDGDVAASSCAVDIAGDTMEQLIENGKLEHLFRKQP